ncbi:MAG TPA: glutamine-hydrolyzing carbamoyl-phosphate synthase small subunit [Beutenbergiaceae bacterium]|nr:glutamine-hydrolyzing carbamoyl-phosphate synthase small subunit [Beutenbergiaceae bacterium]
MIRALETVQGSAYGPDEALLVLEDGTAARGRAYGAKGRAAGDMVFTTSMTGYQEVLTDPRHAGQIVMMTAPHVGNVGMIPEDSRSGRIWASGLIVRDPARRASHWRAETELDAELRAQDVVGIAEVDTRALTRHLRDHGVLRAGIFSGPHLPSVPGPQGIQPLLAQVRQSAAITGTALSEQVSTAAAYTLEPDGNPDQQGPTVAVLDLGMDTRTLRALTGRGLRAHVLPAAAGADQVLAGDPDGVFFTNGPGDPAEMDRAVEVARAVLAAKIPFLGLGLGHQILGRALGLETYALHAGHRGRNHPVQELDTGKVLITTHNHGFAVQAPTAEPIAEPAMSPYEGGRFGRVRVSHVSLTDQVVEGLECVDVPALSVQFHPGAGHEAGRPYDRFAAMISTDAATRVASEEN